MKRGAGWSLDIGARPLGPYSVHFRVWAPRARNVAVRLVGRGEKTIPLEPRERGYFETTASGIPVGSRYVYVLDHEKARPDPASRFQPEGVHGPSAVINPESFRWSDQKWSGLPLNRFVIYELHTGTFTRDGTFEGIIPMLDYLRQDVGVTAIELMPVAQFPGLRNWGYDGVYLYASQASYGGPEGLKRLVDACHAKGLAVILDVVYNHLGPEGNYLKEYGPYFTDRYRTPWGSAINYDGPDSDQVRDYIVNNALYWVSEYHVDALRLDAIHGIYDFSAYHILRQLADAVHDEGKRLGRSVYVIAESDLNDVRVITSPADGGYGLDGQWNDDFHHALHSVLTGERAGYYQDFGRLDQMASALQHGFVYSGQHSAYRRRRHGNSAKSRRPTQFVVYAQNHDQIGNRAIGDRLSTLVPFDALKVKAAAVLLSPSVPMLFMGEEYGETAPFLYFIDHGDPALVDAVRKGRCAEFAHFGWKQEEIPDPQDPTTFERSRVHPGRQTDPRRAAMLRWTHTLIALRQGTLALRGSDSNRSGHRAWVAESSQVMMVHRWTQTGRAALLILGFNQSVATITLREPRGSWKLRLSGAAKEFGGEGQDSLPDKLVIKKGGLSVTIPAYTAALFLAST